MFGQNGVTGPHTAGRWRLSHLPGTLCGSANGGPAGTAFPVCSFMGQSSTQRERGGPSLNRGRGWGWGGEAAVLPGPARPTQGLPPLSCSPVRSVLKYSLHLAPARCLPVSNLPLRFDFLGFFLCPQGKLQCLGAAPEVLLRATPSPRTQVTSAGSLGRDCLRGLGEGCCAHPTVPGQQPHHGPSSV